MWIPLDGVTHMACHPPWLQNSENSCPAGNALWRFIATSGKGEPGLGRRRPIIHVWIAFTKVTAMGMAAPVT
jgi:hypothetical protein